MPVLIPRRFGGVSALATVFVVGACIPASGAAQILPALPQTPVSAAQRVPTLIGPRFPGWKKVPSALDMARAAPEKAMREGLSGTTILFCSVDPKGLLVGCEIDREDHAGAGFGEAALRLVGKFQMNSTVSDGTSVAGETVKFPIRFISP